jgi:hypothetical protein
MTAVATVAHNRAGWAILVKVIDRGGVMHRSFARIGETYDQAVQRYGKEYDIVKDPVTNDNIYRFVKGNFCVNAVFDNTDRLAGSPT